MKKSVLAIAIGSALLAPCVSFAAPPTVYGKFNVGIDNEVDDIGLDFKTTRSTWKMRDNNNSSRLGVRGDLDVSETLKVIYQLEYGIDPAGTESASVTDNSVDSNGNPTSTTTKISTPLSERNIFVGLRGSAGTLRVGRFDTAVKEIGGKVDQFNDNIGDITSLMVGETRNTSLIEYTAPKLGDAVEFSFTAQPGEGRTSTNDKAAQDTGLADTYYASLTYKGASFDAGAAYANNEVAGLKFDGKTAGVNIARVTAMYKGPVELGALYQTATGINQVGDANNANGAAAKETSWIASLGVNLDAWKLKLQYGQTSGEKSKASRTETAVGADYTLAKGTVAQLYYVTYQDKDRTVSGKQDPKTSAYGMAFIFSF